MFVISMLFSGVVRAQSSGFILSGNLNTGRNSHSATLLNNGMVLIAGGWNGALLASAELYNPATGVFTPTGSMHTARENHMAVLLQNGMVLVVGGWNGHFALNSAELYNPSTGTFTVTGNLNVARVVRRNFVEQWDGSD